MVITKERTRLIFKDYTDLEKRKLEDLVATIDKVYTYEDIDNEVIYLPTGMEDSIKKAFPKYPIQDNSSQYWNYEYITPVEHEATPRNQLQVDFIKFIVSNAQKGEKSAGILSPGTG